MLSLIGWFQGKFRLETMVVIAINYFRMMFPIDLRVDDFGVSLEISMRSPKLKKKRCRDNVGCPI